MIQPLGNGTVLRGRYRLLRLVGQGGMGCVYEAEDIRLPGRRCALKEVQSDDTASIELQEQFQSQFLMEASILAQLDHPNLPKVSDFFAEGDRDYLVMDYVPGKDLKELVDEYYDGNRWLEESKVLGWADQIMSGLAYLHRQNPPVLHRDIKPANIKLTPDGRIKLVDFGLAKVMVTDDARTITVLQGRGTALYTPLEQYGGDNVHTDVRSDIYALGATLYTLLTNYPPPSAKERFLNPRLLRPPLAINGSIRKRVSEAVMWAMEMHPDDRPVSIDMFAQTLLGDGPGRPVAPREDTWQDALAANRLLLLAVTFLFAVAVAVTIWW